MSLINKFLRNDETDETDFIETGVDWSKSVQSV